MNEEQKQSYADAIVEGHLPDQETFTKEEVKYLVGTVLSWASIQIEHTLDNDVLHDDIPDLIANCEYANIEEAIEDIENGVRNEFESLIVHIRGWIV